MGADLLKQQLHLRIEQADTKMLRILTEFTETLFAEYHIDAGQELSEEDVMALPAPPWAKPLTKEESLADIREGIAEYQRGEYVTLDDIDKEAEQSEGQR